MATPTLPTTMPFFPYAEFMQYLPTAVVFLAANTVTATSSKVKFFANTSVNVLFWGLINFSIAYATTLSTRVIGNADFAPVDKMSREQLLSGNVAYHGALSVLASAILQAGGADSLNFLPGLLFGLMWTIGVYVPLTHWQQNLYSQGWLTAASKGSFGLLDHSGAHHIHMAAGISSLVLLLLLGQKDTKAKGSECWTNAFWAFFAFTGYITLGDPNSASGGQGPALLNILLSVATAVLTAVFIDVGLNDYVKFGQGEPKAANLITAVYYGLIAQVAGASLIAPMWAAFFGFATVLIAYVVSELWLSKYIPAAGWNSVFSIHFLGAAVSSALTGLFASATYAGATASGNAGSFYGNSVQLGKQAAGISVVVVVGAVGTVVIYLFVSAITKAVGGSPTGTAAEAPKAEAPLASVA